jgi:hypothetical protein
MRSSTADFIAASAASTPGSKSAPTSLVERRQARFDPCLGALKSPSMVAATFCRSAASFAACCCWRRAPARCREPGCRRAAGCHARRCRRPAPGHRRALTLPWRGKRPAPCRHDGRPACAPATAAKRGSFARARLSGLILSSCRACAVSFFAGSSDASAGVAGGGIAAPPASTGGWWSRFGGQRVTAGAGTLAGSGVFFVACSTAPLAAAFCCSTLPPSDPLRAPA